MKVAVLGATGWIGRHIVEEAASRGHEVIALVRDLASADLNAAALRRFDLLDGSQELAEAVAGADVVISAIGGRAAANHDIVARTAQRLLAELPTAGVDRLLWVGGAGTLEVAPGVELVTLPDFPEEYKPEAVAMSEALAVFRGTESTVNWTFVSPAAEIFPGEKQGTYRIGGDELLADEQGASRISVSDYAAAMIDELEAGHYPKQRIGVAY